MMQMPGEVKALEQNRELMSNTLARHEDGSKHPKEHNEQLITMVGHA